jgi:hypothetical protein
LTRNTLPPLRSNKLLNFVFKDNLYPLPRRLCSKVNAIRNTIGSISNTFNTDPLAPPATAAMPPVSVLLSDDVMIAETNG